MFYNKNINYYKYFFAEESEDTGLHAAETVYEILQEVKALDEECHIKHRLDKVDEFVMDAHILNSASAVVIKCLNALQVSMSNYDPIEFANKLVNNQFWLRYTLKLPIFR